MRKGWKYQLVNLFLRAYTHQKDLTASRDAFVNDNQLDTITSIVIYSTTALGDFMMNTPAIHALRQRFPQAYITLVAHPKFESFLEGGGDWDRIVYWNSKIKTVPQLVKALKNRGQPDLAVILHSHAPYDYLSAVMVGARYVFRDNYADNIDVMNRWLTNYTYGFKGHLIQRKLELVAPLGCDISSVEMKLPCQVIKRAARKTNKKVIGFQMGASTPERCWPLENFAQVANTLLAANPESSITLIGGGGEMYLQQPFMEKVDVAFHSRIESLIGKTSLPELVSTINKFDVLITGDTGPLHLAVALKIPTISLFVTAEPSASGPYQDMELHRVLYGVRMALKSELSSEAMKAIPAERVIVSLRDDFNISV